MKKKLETALKSIDAAKRTLKHAWVHTPDNVFIRRAQKDVEKAEKEIRAAIEKCDE